MQLNKLIFCTQISQNVNESVLIRRYEATQGQTWIHVNTDCCPYSSLWTFEVGNFDERPEKKAAIEPTQMRELKIKEMLVW